jgi:hypothetical protein
MMKVRSMPFRFGPPKKVNPSHLSIPISIFEMGSFIDPLERMNTNRNIRKITQKYSGTRRSNLEIYSRSQSIFFDLPSISLEKNKKPVIMKKSATELCPKWVYKLEGGTSHFPDRK